MNLLVKNLVSISGIKFLYTKKIKEQIIYHLVSGFDYKQFRKTDFIDVAQIKAHQKSLLNEYDKYYTLKYKNMMNKKYSDQKEIDMKDLMKEAFFAIQIKDTQINFQNDVSKS